MRPQCHNRPAREPGYWRHGVGGDGEFPDYQPTQSGSVVKPKSGWGKERATQ